MKKPENDYLKCSRYNITSSSFNCSFFCYFQFSNRRSETTSKTARFQRQNEANESANSDFLEADKVSSLQDLIEKIEPDLPKDILKLVNENKVTYYSLKEDDTGRPFVNYSLKIKEDMQFCMFCHEVEVNPSKVVHIFKNKKVNSCIGVVNILVYLKNMSEEKTLQSTNTVEHCIAILDKIVPDLEDDVLKKIGFLIEQLKLAIKNKYARRYSPGLLAWAAICKNVSPALYKQLWEEGNLRISFS